MTDTMKRMIAEEKGRMGAGYRPMVAEANQTSQERAGEIAILTLECKSLLNKIAKATKAETKTALIAKFTAANTRRLVLIG